MAKKKDKVKQIEAEEKAINVVSFEEVQNKKGQGETMGEYFSRQDLRVTRGRTLPNTTTSYGQLIQGLYRLTPKS